MRNGTGMRDGHIHQHGTHRLQESTFSASRLVTASSAESLSVCLERPCRSATRGPSVGRGAPPPAPPSAAAASLPPSPASSALGSTLVSEMMAGILSAISFCNASVRDNSSRIVFGSVNDWNQGQGDATIDAAATTTGPLRQRLHVPQRKRQQMTGASPRGVNTSNSCYV